MHARARIEGPPPLLVFRVMIPFLVIQPIGMHLPITRQASTTTPAHRSSV
jgi:hypothetical protein